MPDPFDVLGLPARFDLDPGAVHAAWLRGSARLHPDLSSAGGAPGDERMARLADLNRARSVLADPIQRAEALLERLGGPAKDADKSLPDGFLLEMLDVREQVEQAAEAEDPDEINRWEAWAERRRAEAVRTVSGLFDAHASGVSGALADIRRELNAWRYIERMLEQLPGG